MNNIVKKTVERFEARKKKKTVLNSPIETNWAPKYLSTKKLRQKTISQSYDHRKKTNDYNQIIETRYFNK